MFQRVINWISTLGGRLTWRVVRLGILLGCGIVGFLAGEPFWDALSRDPALAIRPPASVTLLNRDQRLYMALSDGRVSRRVAYDELPDYMVKAVLAREDSRYWTHFGVDLKGFARAFVTNLKSGRVRQGGSTITMQLVQHVYGRPEGNLLASLQEKVFEAVMAIRIELWASNEFKDRRAGKEALLTNYLNVVSFGHGTRGLAEAAYHQFNGKKPAEMTLGECAYMAGLLRAPSKNSAYINEENARLARDKIRDRLTALNWITPKEAENMNFYVGSHPKRPQQPGDGFTREVARKEISRLTAEGKVPKDLESLPGVEVVMTLDMEFQTQAQRVLREEIQSLERSPGYGGKPGELDGAVVVFDHSTGGALALVGGRDFTRRQFNCALQGKRTIASTIKPFVFASYLEAKGLAGDAMLPNTPLVRRMVGNLPGNLEPRETSQLSSGRSHRLTDGLAFSSNRMTLQAGAATGWPAWQSNAEKLGLWQNGMVSSTDAWLGACEVSPWQATAAFMTLARGGSCVTPHVISEVRQRQGKTLTRIWQERPTPVLIFQPATMATIHEGLRQVLLKGTASGKGRSFALKVPSVAGKTGTSDDVSDAWFIGYTDSMTIGVWIGFPEGRKAISKHGDGATIAYPVFERIVKSAPGSFPNNVSF
jgi:penicillin-binding protein 1A